MSWHNKECIDCTECIYSYNCTNCDKCCDCIECVNCIDSDTCIKCTGCVTCDTCISCSNCTDLWNGIECIDFKGSKDYREYYYRNAKITREEYLEHAKAIIWTMIDK